jgi:hypothetical protein
MFMKKCTPALFILLSPTPVAAETESPVVSLSTFLSYVNITSEGALSPAFGLGVSASYHITPKISTEAAFHVVPTYVVFDNVGVVGTTDVLIHLYEVRMRYIALAPAPGFDVSITSGLGLASFATDQRRVSIGALGQAVIPGKTDTRGAVTFGSVLSARFGSRVAVQAEPRLLFLSTWEPNYIVTGGITIGVL